MSSKNKIVRAYKTNYTKNELEHAIEEICSGKSILSISLKYKIPYGTLHNKFHGRHGKEVGHPMVFTKTEEDLFAKTLQILADGLFPLGEDDLRVMLKYYLDKIDRIVPQFKENTPGYDWAKGFMKRHKDLSLQLANNLKIARSSNSKICYENYYSRLRVTLQVDNDIIPPSNIFNLDETNLVDNPGRKKVICKRRKKYINRHMNHSKSAHSLMLCGSADGCLLPLYIVYKSLNLWNTWTENGPRAEKPFCACRACSKGCRYNNTPSGWFDSKTFEDFIESVFIPHIKLIPGKKILLCDNLSSHVTPRVIALCEENNVGLTCMPPNSTHICQPLDVTFFAPMKRLWRKILEKWKLSNINVAVLPKSEFPNLVKNLFCGFAEAANKNLKVGFEACGIFPFNPQKVMAKLPSTYVEPTESESVKALSDAIGKIVSPVQSKEKKAVKRKKKVRVIPGKSITMEDFNEYSPHYSKDKPSKMKKPIRNKVPQNHHEESETDPDSPDTESECSLSENEEQNVGLEKLDINDYILVKYVGKTKDKHYIGLVKEAANHEEKHNGYDWRVTYMRKLKEMTYIFPEKEDIDTIGEEAIEFKLLPPVPARRDAWKFEDKRLKKYCVL